MTDELSVISERGNIANLKDKYLESLRRYHDVLSTGRKVLVNELIDVHSSALCFLNKCEDFVGNSSLLDAHQNGLWVTGFAEDCYANLETLILHTKFIKNQCEIHGFRFSDFQHSTFAFANMQRMVVKYLPKEQCESLLKDFKEESMPTVGFTQRAAADKSAIPGWQKYLGASFGVIGVIIELYFIKTAPNPTAWQEFVLRAILAFSISAFIPLIDGFVHLSGKLKLGDNAFIKILAGGSIAIFLILLLYNPKRISVQTETPAKQQVESIKSN